MADEKPSILLVTSNGTGMGHLTRQSAVAAALGDRADVVLLSLSTGLPVVAGPDLRCEYLPSYQRPWMPRQEWNDYLCDRVVALAEEVRADVVAFDGVAPYRGLVLARRRLPSTAFVWFRRGMWRAGRNIAALRTEPFFDLVIEPGDLAAKADAGATRPRSATRIPPVSLLDVLDPLPREAAAGSLGLDAARPTALVTLGSGALGDVDVEAAAALEVLLADGFQVATTKAALAGATVTGAVAAAEDVHLLTEVYPLARYVRAFDVVVTAAGYNAVHEFVTAGIPTVLVPNALTATDDQVARARSLDADCIAVWADPTAGGPGVAEAVRRCLASRESLADAARAAASVDHGGAQAAADALLHLARRFENDSPTAGRRLARARFLARSAVTGAILTAIGPTLADRLRQSRRARVSAGGPTRTVEVDLVVDSDLAERLSIAASSAPSARDSRWRARLTGRLDSTLLRGDSPVEHVLVGSSDDYVRRRTAIARSAYDVRSITRAEP